MKQATEPSTVAEDDIPQVIGFDRIAGSEGQTAPDATPAASADAAVPVPELIAAAEAARDRRDWGAALAAWQAVRNASPDEATAAIGAAQALRELGRLEEAALLLREATARFPAHAGIQHDLGRVAERLGDWAEAEACWRRFVALDPGPWWGYANLAHALNRLERAAEADAVMAAAQQRQPGEFGLFLEYARLAERRGDWQEALARWERVRERFPQEWAGHTGRVAALRGLGREDEAMTALREAAARFPAHPGAQHDLARLAEARGDWAEAEHHWRRFLALDAAPWWAHTSLAHALARQDRSAEAEAVLVAAQESLPQEPALFADYARLAEGKREWETALRRWNAARTRFPAEPLGYTRAAACLIELHRYDEAEALLTDTLQRFPHDAEAARAHAMIALRRDDPATAAQRLQLAVERNPADFGLARQWVEAMHRLRRPAEARAALDSVRRRFPDAPELTQQAVRIQWQAGEQDEAVALWASSVADPDFPREPTFRLAAELLADGAAADHARKLIAHLATEPDTGERYWRPLLAPLLRPDQVRQDHAAILTELVRTSPASAFTPAVRDVVCAALQLDLTDEDIRRFFDTYLARERLGVAGCLFSNIDRPGDDHTRARAAFEAYVAERLHQTDWITEEAAGELVALLQFAAVASHAAYRDLVGAARARLDVAALAGRHELQTAQGILGSILGAAGRGTAPAVATTPCRLRVALCISGQLRGYQQAFRSWDALRLDRHDTAIFVDCWSAVGLNWERIWAFTRGDASLHHTLYTGGLGFVRSRYPRLAAALDQAITASGTVTVRQLQEFYGTRHVALEDDTDIAFAGRSNQWKMYYKMARALHSAKESGREFDLLIRARPDREIIDASGFDIAEIHAISAAENILFMLDHPFVLRDGGHYWLGDQFAFGTPSVISTFCSILADIEAFAAAGRLPRDIDPSLPMHFTPFLMMFYRGILARPIPGVEFGNFINPPLLTVGEIHDLLLQDLQSRAADDFDRSLAAACERAL